ncbi:MAG: hypothetical protein AMK71_04740 [Nitrospira bacterium SG8_35_4]|nr:MAG: hypothetical protein AMK71_04740 [Nitrospira bacterium SG8_35_4]
MYFFITLVFLCFVISPAAAPDSEQSINRRHFLWSVEGRKATVYILGSIHLLKKDSYPLPAAIENIFSCCNKIAFETDLDGMKKPEMQNMMMTLGMYPAGRTLSKNISKNTYTLLREKLHASGITIERFEQFKPWFVAINLAGLELERMGFDPALGVDRYFFDRARQERKNMLYLETNEFQINLFARFSPQKQETLLKQTLEELTIIETLFKEMIDAWRTGDHDLFNSIMSKSFNEYPSIYNKLFIRRNRNWIPELIKLMNQQGDALVIVGAGHLVGKDSVIDLLKKKGYKVDQL